MLGTTGTLSFRSLECLAVCRGRILIRLGCTLQGLIRLLCPPLQPSQLLGLGLLGPWLLHLPIIRCLSSPVLIPLILLVEGVKGYEQPDPDDDTDEPPHSYTVANRSAEASTPNTMSAKALRPNPVVLSLMYPPLRVVSPNKSIPQDEQSYDLLRNGLITVVALS